MNAIVLDAVSKQYPGGVLALEHLNLTIPEGRVFGFLGPNGAGKTTAVRIINGILQPTSGHISVFGHDSARNSLEIHKLSGVMTESARCYEQDTARENLLLYGSLHRLTGSRLSDNVDRTLREVGLYEERNRKVKHYSSGMKKRMYLAIALVHEPRILFLDEPTAGLDPHNALIVTELIANLVKSKGVTVFLCTHQLPYAEAICSDYGFIRKGSLLAFGSFNSLLKAKHMPLLLQVKGKQLSRSFVYDAKQDCYLREITHEDEVAAILQQEISQGASIREAIQQKWDLEKLYFSYFEEGES